MYKNDKVKKTVWHAVECTMLPQALPAFGKAYMLWEMHVSNKRPDIFRLFKMRRYSSVIRARDLRADLLLGVVTVIHPRVHCKMTKSISRTRDTCKSRNKK